MNSSQASEHFSISLFPSFFSIISIISFITESFFLSNDSFSTNSNWTRLLRSLDPSNLNTLSRNCWCCFHSIATLPSSMSQEKTTPSLQDSPPTWLQHLFLILTLTPWFMSSLLAVSAYQVVLWAVVEYQES